MLGAIIGDIVGSRWEFNPTNNYNFELFSDKNSFTDDTVCTIAVADAILHHKGFGTTLHEWCRRYPHPMGSYGGRFARWIAEDDFKPYGSFGNGSAMRVSAVGWAFNDIESVLTNAEASAACTHNHPEGIKGAQTVALAIHLALQLRKKYAGRLITPKSIRELVIEPCVKFSGYDINIHREDVMNRFDETCQGTVPVALWVISHSHNFEDAIRMAVSLGADADTLGAIVGSIAEVIWPIPNDIREKALDCLPLEMRAMLHDFRKAVRTHTPRFVYATKDDLVSHCENYKGEPEKPNDSDVGHYWHYEKMWVELTLRAIEKGEPYKAFDKDVMEYVNHGLRDFDNMDNTPVTLKALLFNRYCHWTCGSVEEFKQWYHEDYKVQV